MRIPCLLTYIEYQYDGNEANLLLSAYQWTVISGNEGKLKYAKDNYEEVEGETNPFKCRL